MYGRTISNYPASAVDLPGQQERFEWINAYALITEGEAPIRTQLRAARTLGYRLIRGAYSGTSDNRIDRWYWDRLDSDVIDRRGEGHSTQAEALDTLRERLTEDRYTPEDFEHDQAEELELADVD